MNAIALIPQASAANDTTPAAIRPEHVVVALFVRHTPDHVLRRLAAVLAELHDVQALRDGPNGYGPAMRLVREEIAARRAVKPTEAAR